MHIHPPKPVHGWRSFLGEVGIIVLGILIALGLEQVIEAAHWREKVEQATAAVRSDLELYAGQAAEQQVAAPCIDRQLEQLEAALTTAGDYKPAPLYHQGGSLPFTFREPGRFWESGVWRAVVSEGVSSHFDPKLRERLEFIYQAIDWIKPLAIQSDTTKWRLSSLSKPLFAGASERARLVEEIEEQRGRQSLLTLVSGELLYDFGKAGMMPAASVIQRFVATSPTTKFCREHGLPLGSVKPLSY